MQFKLYFVDSGTEAFYRSAAAEYEKRLGRYCRIEVIPVKQEKALLKKIETELPTVLLTPKGSCISSEILAEKIKETEQSGMTKWNIVIGERSEEFQKKIDAPLYTAAVTPLRISDGLTLVTVLEQIYRAYKILHREPYHK